MGHLGSGQRTRRPKWVSHLALTRLTHSVHSRTRRVGDVSRKQTTPRRQQLGRALRELREGAGMTIEAAAPRLYWSSSKLGRIEQGYQRVDVHGVRSMLDLYDIGGTRWTEVTELALRAQEPGWWRAYGLDDRGYVPLEADATLVRDYTIGYVPGLLQTAAYTRALSLSYPKHLNEQDLALSVQIRNIRQRRLIDQQNPLELAAIVDEGVLHRPVGGPEVMRDQLRRIVESAALDRVTFQVLPTAVGARPGLSSVFTLLSFEAIGFPDMVYVEHPMGAVQMAQEDSVERATIFFDRLRSLALSPADSVALVHRAAEQM